MYRQVRISKTLSKILRHTASKLGIDVRADGFCNLAAVLKTKHLRDVNCTLQDVLKVVAENDKKRFEIWEGSGEHYIRATQGHSIKWVDDEELHTKLSLEDNDLPTACVHGTYRKLWPNILNRGLLIGGGRSNYRNHIHFSPHEPGDGRIISGMRYDCEVAIWLDIEAAMRDGIAFSGAATRFC